MNKSAIKNFAIEARKKLIASVKDKAGRIGITKDSITDPIGKGEGYAIFPTHIGIEAKLTGKEVKQRENLVSQIKSKENGYEQVMEEVAYTWFNRLIAIRFMEVNDYLPSRVRVLSSETAGKFEPDIVTQAPEVDLEFSQAEREEIFTLKEKNALDQLFRLLFIKQCNELGKILPELFENTSKENNDYTEILLDISYTNEDGVLRDLLKIDEADFLEAVEIIGWLYQYYNTEPKDETFALLKKNVKITKERIPAATQLFTPDWIVRYMVENSLGRIFVVNSGQWAVGSERERIEKEKVLAEKMGWKYYLPEAEQSEEVRQQLITNNYALTTNFNVENIKVIDPCMGSGHILVYAFDVLMDIYKSCGYSERDAVKLILQHNLYGLDIDDRAYQLAYFAVMMKARAYSRRILNEGIRPHLCAIQESNGVDSGQWAVGSGQWAVESGQWAGDSGQWVVGRGQWAVDSGQWAVDSGQWAVGSGQWAVGSGEWSGEVQETLRYVLDVFHDAKEYGSILHVEQRDYQAVLAALAGWERTCELTLENHSRLQQLPLIRSLLRQAEIMAQNYDVVVTNPPYMGSGGMSGKLSEYVKKYYADSKADLFAVFIEKGLEMANNVGYNCMVTMQTWMFLSSFEKLREKLLKTKTINNLMHMENMVMGIAFGTAVTVFHNRNIGNYKGTYNYIKLSDIGNKNKPREFPVKKNRFAQISMENFKTIPGMPIAYWIKNYTIFLARKFSESHFSGGRNKTHNNEIFVRKWWETKQTFDWKPYSNGGVFRKWYGNNLDVVLWTPEARNIYSKHGGLLNEKFWDKEGITWNDITSGLPSFRIKAKDSIFSSVSPTVLNSFCKCDYIVLGFCNSKVSIYLLNITNPTMHTLVGNVLDLPDLTSRAPKVCAKIVKDNIHLAKSDWDSFETSWDFARHPLLKHYTYDDRPLRLPAIFRVWATETEEAFAQLKANEEELNRIFIDIYGLQDELTPEVDDKDITIRKADLQRDIRSFISYAVGCMFGRYSLDVDGLVYAGGDFTNHYPLTTNHFDSLTTNHYHVDADNVIPITDTEYFSDDIVTRFVEFIKVVYGQETLEENLDFTAQALGNKGNTSREIIRNYFLKDFYADHVKIYQKRPIYWLFDSGKENGFKALMYMHRYDQDTVGRVRADYLHKAQAFIENAISHCDVVRESNAPASEKAKAVKQKEKLVKQLAETRLYDQAIAHIAYQRIAIELDDGVVVNYAKFQGVEVANEGKKAVKIDLLAKV